MIGYPSIFLVIEISMEGKILQKIISSFEIVTIGCVKDVFGPPIIKVSLRLSLRLFLVTSGCVFSWAMLEIPVKRHTSMIEITSHMVVIILATFMRHNNAI